mmetsp:Transcript_55701/g.121294  ORF Transcript_55701/g.121294 Transcript_55701/m.121294 type:complete len:282 (+) Transcript_55701:450-1295(+)
MPVCGALSSHRVQETLGKQPPVLLKSYRGYRYATDGDSYWFSSRLGKEAAAVVVILDYLNGTVDGLAVAAEVARQGSLYLEEDGAVADKQVDLPQLEQLELDGLWDIPEVHVHEAKQYRVDKETVTSESCEVELTKFKSPRGPILLQSHLTTADGPIRWLMHLSGNACFSFGVLPADQQHNAQYLHEGFAGVTPRVGIVNTPTDGCALKRIDCDNVWIEAMVGSSVAVFHVLRPTGTERHEFAIPDDWEHPLRLAVCTWAGTIVRFAQVGDSVAHMVKPAR